MVIELHPVCHCSAILTYRYHPPTYLLLSFLLGFQLRRVLRLQCNQSICTYLERYILPQYIRTHGTQTHQCCIRRVAPLCPLARFYSVVRILELVRIIPLFLDTARREESRYYIRAVVDDPEFRSISMQSSHHGCPHG